jgi:hypothetical protein
VCSIFDTLETSLPFVGATKVDDSAHAQRNQNSMVLQGQEHLTLRTNNLTDSNDSDATVQKPMMWSPSPNIGKPHPLNFQQRPSMDNWMQLGRREADKDACSGAQPFGDSPGFFMQTFGEAPNRLGSFKNQFQDHSSARHYSDPYLFMHQQPSMTVESSTKMQTETNELHFWNGPSSVYGNSRNQPQGFRFEDHPSNWLTQQHFSQAEHPRVIRPQASIAPVDLQKPREGSGFKIFGFKVDTASGPSNNLSSPMAATHEPLLQAQPSASLNQLQHAPTDCFPEVSVSTAGTTDNEKGIQQAPQSSKDVQSKSHGASTRSCTKV